jgi:hypothetical protein
LKNPSEISWEWFAQKPKGNFLNDFKGAGTQTTSKNPKFGFIQNLDFSIAGINQGF